MHFSHLVSLLFSVPVALAIEAPNVDGMKTTWSESFNGCQGCSPNGKVWNTVLALNTNDDLQTYTDTSSNVQLSGGETLQLVPWKSPLGLWTSGRIETKEAYTPQPGKKMRFQASLRTGENANKQGMWPAFWMLGDAIRHGTEWPLCGELDIFEQVNGEMTGYGTVHCQQEDGGVCNQPSGLGEATAIPDSDFHVWSLEVDRTSNNWETETITWSMDGNSFHVLSGAALGDEDIWATVAHSPMYLILNVAVGGSWPVRIC